MTHHYGGHNCIRSSNIETDIKQPGIGFLVNNPHYNLLSDIFGENYNFNSQGLMLLSAQVVILI